MTVLVFNERAWAIDLISEINFRCRSRQISIKRASGESGLRTQSTTLFPDVILHGVDGILQGWELKLPDTDLHDTELLRNAGDKADLLGTNSFLVWNGREAALWVRDLEPNTFKEIKTWVRPELSDRKSVEKNKKVWEGMLDEILTDLDFYLTTGIIKKKTNTEFLDEEFASKLVEALYSPDASAIEEASLRDEKLRIKIQEWAIDNEIESTSRFNELARLNILAWVNRFVFCHYLSRFNPIALKVQKITSQDSVTSVKSVFEDISKVMDFGNVFVAGIADEIMSSIGWQGRLEFNNLLTDTGVSELPENSLRNVLEDFAFVAKRKSQGQFATPKNLASALAYIALDDLTGQASDPCCGSGTIAKAMYEIKVQEGMGRTDSLETIWASDKYQMPLQLTSMNLSDPKAIKSLVQVFRSNVFDLETGMSVELTDPEQPGKKITKAVPKFDAIASNLPYVRQEILEGKGPDSVFKELEQRGLSGASRKFGKADLYASIIFKLDTLLSDTGRICVVVSNSWMGTTWGASFQDQIRKQYHLRAVIKSGSGRWFKNADVVATILVLEKKKKDAVGLPVNFVTTLRNLEDWDADFLKQIKSAALSGSPSPEAKVIAVTDKDLDFRRSKGFYWRFNFHQQSFLNDFLNKSVPISRYLEVARGARTGQDDFFYPDPQTLATIEDEYKVPLIKNSKECKSLLVEPTNFAFSCSRTIDELVELGHTGALAWIRKFQNRVNGMGKPLVEVLALQNNPWYFLSPKETGDLALSLNPFQVLAVYRASTPVFMNQRLVRLTSKGGDLDLIHALLNSSFGMLAQEFLGFGRGEGVLDLRNDSVKKDMHILDPALVSSRDAEQIKIKFAPLLRRDCLPLHEELKQRDRVAFEETVLAAYGLSEHASDLFSLLERGMAERLDSAERTK